jgi:hypothetical protein
VGKGPRSSSFATRADRRETELARAGGREESKSDERRANHWKWIPWAADRHIGSQPEGKRRKKLQGRNRAEKHRWTIRNARAAKLCRAVMATTGRPNLPLSEAEFPTRWLLFPLHPSPALARHLPIAHTEALPRLLLRLPVVGKKRVLVSRSLVSREPLRGPHPTDILSLSLRPTD